MSRGCPIAPPITVAEDDEENQTGLELLRVLKILDPRRFDPSWPFRPSNVAVPDADERGSRSWAVPIELVVRRQMRIGVDAGGIVHILFKELKLCGPTTSVVSPVKWTF